MLADPGRLLRGIIERGMPLTCSFRSSLQTVRTALGQYPMASTSISGDPNRGIGVFFNFGTADGRTNPIQHSYNMGIVGNGGVPGRPQGTLGLA